VSVQAGGLGVTTTTVQAPPAGPGTGPAGVVAHARAAVAGLAEELWAAKAPDALLAVNAEIERLRSTLAAVQAQVAVEIDAAEAHKTAAWASAGDYLTATSGARQGAGRRILHTGHALTTDRHATCTALRDGRISPEHAEVIVRCLDLLPVDAGLREAGEAFLLQHAAALNATELDKLGHQLLEVLDPDGTARREEKKLDKLERSAHLHRFLSLVEDGLGGVRVRGRGTVEDAAVIKTALAALSAPLPSTDPETGTEARDPRDAGARTWDALVEACQRLADARVLPGDHGMKPRILVTIDHDQLKAGVGEASLVTGERLSVAALRKLACDADLLPVVLSADGAVLDLGRTQRLVTTPLWLALIARDQHCAFPGCRRPPIACDAHHLTHWADGGPTNLANLVLLCRAHHTLIHTTPWQIRLNPTDQLPEFKPPPGRRLAPDHPGQPALSHDHHWIRERRPRE
jgi:hypothetical protein